VRSVSAAILGWWAASPCGIPFYAAAEIHFAAGPSRVHITMNNDTCHVPPYGEKIALSMLGKCGYNAGQATTMPRSSPVDVHPFSRNINVPCLSSYSV
jgi:hypothetical protein